MIKVHMDEDNWLFRQGMVWYGDANAKFCMPMSFSSSILCRIPTALGSKTTNSLDEVDAPEYVYSSTKYDRACLRDHRFWMLLASLLCHWEERPHWLHVLSIIFPVVVSHFLQHFVDASLVQSSLFNKSARCKAKHRVGCVTD